MNYTCEEIRDKINKNKILIQDIMGDFNFTLDNRLNKVLEENEFIRSQCKHEFINGICKWCDEEES